MKKNYYTFYGVLAITGSLLMPVMVPVHAMNPGVLEESSANSDPIEWAGSSQVVTFYSASDVRKFIYTSTLSEEDMPEELYFVCREKAAANFGVSMEGADDYGDVSISFDPALVMGKIELSAFNKANLTVQATGAATYPCTFTIDLFRIPKSWSNTGKFFDQPYVVTEGKVMTIPANKYYSDPSDPSEVKDEKSVTWVSFTASKTGKSALAADAEHIYLYDFDSANGVASNGRKLSQQTELMLPFLLDVEKDKEYLVAVCNERPSHVSFQFPSDLTIGKNSVTLTSDFDRKVYTYASASENGEMLYLQNKAVDLYKGYPVYFSGSTRANELLSYSDYEQAQGGYSAISLKKGDVLDFSVMTALNEKEVPFPRRIDVEAITVPFVYNQFSGQYDLPGNMFDAPIELTEAEIMVAPCENTSSWIPLLKDQGNVTWASFKATDDALVNVEIAEYMIYVFEMQGEDPVNGRTVTLPNLENSKTAHRFGVTAGVEYRIAFINKRPLPAKMIISPLVAGDDCSKPIEQGKGEILPVAGKQKWYAYTPAEGENYMILSADDKFAGNISVYTSCDDITPTGIDVLAGATGEYRSVVTPGNTYLIKITASKEASKVTLSGRAALEGESCETAFTGILGTNKLGKELRTYWYKHTASKACLLHLEGPAKSTLKFNSDCTGRVVGTGIVENGKMTFDYKMNEGETVYVLWTPTEAVESTFTMAENEIPETYYCDYPGSFEVGNTLDMKNRLGDTWYQFTTDNSGFVEFIVSEENWIGQSWTSYLREECNGKIINALTAEMINGSVHFKYPVQKGKTYLFYVYQYPTLSNGNQLGPNIQVETAFVAAASGEACDNPTSLTLGVEHPITNGVKSEWFKLVAAEEGFYAIDAIIGEGYTCAVTAYLNVCGSNAEGKANGQYGGNNASKTFTIYAAAGDEILLNATTNVEDGFIIEGQMVKVSYARAAVEGDVCAKAIIAKADTEYAYSKEKDMWYSFVVPAGKTIEVRTAKTSASPVFYQACNGSVVTTTHFTKTMPKDENGKLISVFTQKEAASEDQTFLLKVPANSMGTTMTITVTGSTGIGSVNIRQITVYPNPNNGVFYVSVEDLKEGASVMVSDLTGKSVYTQELTDNLTNIVLDEAAGIYIVTVNNGSMVVNQRMIIRK